ncbi:MAG: type 2 isopentenyl-diphosphate Delta-isomerase [Thermoplasmatales archaeon B_DKE]|nr:MAG: type 2 isopentenyl-diphosphate Delta-isomerase [Thermoplasmatales archaeon B_DKE]QRF75210.1 Isopentenyl-diphosphate delta-isomerase [Thermoplasmatales archaeon]
MIENRKEEHIRIAEKEVVSSEYNYWDDIKIIHQAIPEVDFDRIDTEVEFLGKSSRYPFLISSMTGGTELAKRINGNLAAAAEHFAVGMGVGSMRAAVEKKELAETYSVINQYRIPFKVANIGAPQLINQKKAAFSDSDIEYCFNLIDADFLIVHFNFLQEMVQPEGDRNARGVLKRLSDIASSYPVIAKETGNGFSREAAAELKDAGVKAIDVGGLGGTSFAAIEYYRAVKASDSEKMHSGKTFWNWGIPSPASIKYCNVGLPIIGSGGLRNGLDLAKSIMMGARLGGFARNFLNSADKSLDALKAQIDEIIRDLKVTMFLTSSGNVDDLRKARFIVTEPLKSWVSAYGE